MKLTLEASNVMQQKRSEEPILDLKAALERLGGSQELLQEMISFYLEDYSILLDRIKEAAEDGDPISLSRNVHSLKGLAANFDAVQVIEAADATTQAVRTSAGLMPDNQIAALATAANELAEHLRAVQNEEK